MWKSVKKIVPAHRYAALRGPCLAIALAGVLLVGCKEAGVDRPAGDKASDDSTAEGGRTGKVDFGSRRPVADTDPAEPGAAPAEGGGYQPGERGTPEDLDSRRRQRIAQFDHDGDGKISDAERAAARRTRAEDLHKRSDTDGDGKLTPDELAKGNFRRLDPGSVDLDKNGEISVDEIVHALEQRNRAWGGGRVRGFGAGFRQRAGSGSAAPR